MGPKGLEGVLWQWVIAWLEWQKGTAVLALLLAKTVFVGGFER